MSFREAYIRVAIVDDSRDMVRCLPVNEQHEAFDGAGCVPCYLSVHKDAIVEAPIQREVDDIQLYYNMKKFNQPRKQVTS